MWLPAVQCPVLMLLLLFNRKYLRWLPAVQCPVLMLHAEDDPVVPFHLGEDLYNKTRQAGKTNIRYFLYLFNYKLMIIISIPGA